jgi:7-cyano-7-deazaguanine synthase
MNQAVLSLSGGLDSSTLLLHLLNKNYNVTCLSFDYGQKHKVELEKAVALVRYLNYHRWEKDIRQETNEYYNDIQQIDRERGETKVDKEKYPHINHHIIKLDGLSELLNSTLVEGGSDVPEGHYKEENMKDTVVPNRNKIFSSIIQAVALSIANKHNCNVLVGMGLHAGDHSIYPDCDTPFRNLDYDAFLMGNWGAEKVRYYTPYIEVSKAEVLKDGINCCNSLGLDYKEIYKRTNTSYKPIFIDGKWYSDYKSASSVERIESFMTLGIEDPVAYANTKPVTWDEVVIHTNKILKAYEENSK